MKKIIISLLVLFLLVCGAKHVKFHRPPVDLTSACVAQWKMDDDAASTDVIDSVGSYTGTAQQDTCDINAVGKMGGALSFNGTADYVSCGVLVNVVFTDSYTINLWSKLNLVSGSDNILGVYNVTNGHILRLFRDFGEDWLYFYYGNNSTANLLNLEANYSAYNGEWVMITITVTKTETGCAGKIYMNGVNVVDVDDTEAFDMATFDSDTHEFMIGTNEYSALFFDGSIDNVQIFNRVLIQTATARRSCPNEN